MFGCNVQCALDSRHHLIVAREADLGSASALKVEQSFAQKETAAGHFSVIF
jgi:hypothetical protein